MTEINHCLLCKNSKQNEFTWFCSIKIWGWRKQKRYVTWFCSEECLEKFVNKLNSE